jgi:glycosyltransferase involved in cell wall biosynthesis
MKKISVVIPAFNEEACVDELSERLRKVFSKESQYFLRL